MERQKQASANETVYETVSASVSGLPQSFCSAPPSGFLLLIDRFFTATVASTSCELSVE
jgi:hypothetical protein